MKQGIHLGAPVGGRRSALAAFLLGLTLIATVAHLSWLAIGYQRVGELRRELIELDPAGAWVDEAEVDPEYRSTLAVVGAVMEAGRLDSVSPVAALAMLAERLPPGVRLESLKLSASSPEPTLTLAAVARDTSAIGRLQSSLGEAPMVGSTVILEERPTLGGDIAVRVQLGLKAGRQDVVQ